MNSSLDEIQIDQDIYKQVHFNAYLTIRQKELLKQLAIRMNQSNAELVRMAVHYFLRDNGLDDGLICDREEMLESLPEIQRLRGRRR